MLAIERVTRTLAISALCASLIGRRARTSKFCSKLAGSFASGFLVRGQVDRCVSSANPQNSGYREHRGIFSYARIDCSSIDKYSGWGENGEWYCHAMLPSVLSYTVVVRARWCRTLPFFSVTQIVGRLICRARTERKMGSVAGKRYAFNNLLSRNISPIIVDPPAIVDVR